MLEDQPHCNWRLGWEMPQRFKFSTIPLSVSSGTYSELEIIHMAVIEGSPFAIRTLIKDMGASESECLDGVYTSVHLATLLGNAPVIDALHS